MRDPAFSGLKLAILFATVVTGSAWQAGRAAPPPPGAGRNPASSSGVAQESPRCARVLGARRLAHIPIGKIASQWSTCKVVGTTPGEAIITPGRLRL